MQKQFYILSAFFLVLILLISGCQQLQLNRAREQVITQPASIATTISPGSSQASADALIEAQLEEISQKGSSDIAQLEKELLI